MENAVDALKMAAAIVIFVIAISSSFSIFSIAKQTADSIITMQDKQAYLQSAELDGILYTTKSSLGETQFTDKGDRIVNIEDVVSTISRYSKEKYAVSIIDLNGSTGTVVARYDRNIEAYVSNYNEIISQDGNFFKKYQEKIKEYLKTEYCSDIEFFSTDPTKNRIENLYKISYSGNPTANYGAPWLVDEEQITTRIHNDLEGDNYTYQGQVRTSIVSYGLKVFLKTKQNEGKKIVEVTNEIDKSKYLKDNTIQTNLLQQHEIPSIEIVYIII